MMDAVEVREWVDGVLESVVAAGPLEIWREADNLRDLWWMVNEGVMCLSAIQTEAG
jgi:hypothetical protein